MIRPDVPIHYIRGNEQSRIPKRHIFLDTESTRDRTKSGEVQEWRCGVANFVHWSNRGKLHSEYVDYTDAEHLWKEITAFVRPKKRTVVWAHNLPYDIRISRALSILPKLGWNLVDIRLASKGAWAKFENGDLKLTLCDSTSVFPCSLATVARTFGLGKKRLPTSDDMGAWLARCRRDVEILSTALITYLEWLNTGAAGNWQVTGAGQSWAHWRHSHYTHKILVHDDQVATEAERRAMWAGRAEVWQWGIDVQRHVYDYDWQNAYPRIARDCELPTQLTAMVEAPSWRQTMAWCGTYAVLAKVTVTTREPVVPTEMNGGIGWPVGTFDTTLWSPELRLLADTGAQVDVHRVWLYKRAPALRQWGEWILRELHDPAAQCPPWRKLVLKHWSRALIGRFGMRYRAWNYFGRMPSEALHIGKVEFADDGTSTDMMQIGRDVFTLGELTEVRDGCPQITGYIMSEMRSRLWHAARLIGREHVLYMDTDSLLLTDAGHKRARKMLDNPLLDGLRLKKKYTGYEIYGPRQYIVGGEPRFAGMPKRAVRLDSDTWVGEVWSSPERSMQTLEPTTVRITDRRFHVSWNQKRRAFAVDGSTLPYQLPSMQAVNADRVWVPDDGRESPCEMDSMCVRFPPTPRNDRPPGNRGRYRGAVHRLQKDMVNRSG